MRRSTRLLHPDLPAPDAFGASSLPIYLSSTFDQSISDRFDYARSGNPTRANLEGTLAQLEGAAWAGAYASGLAALTALLDLVEPGGQIVAGIDLYGGTWRLLHEVARRRGIDVRAAALHDDDAAEQAVTDRTRLVLCETPGNPSQRICDIRRLARLCHARGARLAVDNTLLSPLLQRPLSLGADFAVYSATKHLGGHSDLTAGVICCADEEIGRRLAYLQNATGSALAPFDAWLLLRGLRTLAVRVAHQQRSALRLAGLLRRTRGVDEVIYSGLPDHPRALVHRAQARGGGTVIGVRLGSPERARAFTHHLRLFPCTVSFGSCTSSACLTASMSHASLPPDIRSCGLAPEDLVRLSIGLEDWRDLRDDIEAALRAIATRDDEPGVRPVNAACTDACGAAGYTR